MTTRLTVFRFKGEYFASFGDPGDLKLGPGATVIFIIDEDLPLGMDLASLAGKGKAEARRRNIDFVVGLDNVVFDLN